MSKATPAAHAAAIKRPFATHYYTLANDHLPDVVSHGAAATEQGAIRAAIVRIFMGQYQKAVIFDRYTGVAVYHIRPGAGGLSVRYGSGVDFKQWELESARRRKRWEAERAAEALTRAA
jgi:hypothetical protein